MGGSSSRLRLHSDHTQDAPMWVIKVLSVLEMTGKCPAHQVLKAKELLLEWRQGMFTVFVSHQWLSRHHPDPSGQQLRVLQGLLRNFIAQKLSIERDIVSQFYGFGRKAQLCNMQEAYLWLDYFCVPQHGQHVLEIDQLSYVQSIPSYVELCDVFLALVPPSIHHDTGLACDFHSWLKRGWCRTELWCKFLSTNSQIPVIIAKGADVAHFSTPQWYRHPVCAGEFSVEQDRTTCCVVIEKALSRYVAELGAAKKMTAYRFYNALFQELTGLEEMVGVSFTEKKIQGFMEEFCFSPGPQKHKGLGPAACAVLRGEHELLRELVGCKASLETHAPGMPEVFNMPDFTPLHLAVWFKSHDLKVLETLLELKADPNSSTMNVAPPLGFCRTVGAVDLLVSHGAGVNSQGKQIAQYCPLHNAATFGAPYEVVERLLQLRADVNGGRGGLASQSPLHNVAFCGDSLDDFRRVKLLLEYEANINQFCEPEGIFRSIEKIARTCSRCLKSPSALVRCNCNLSTSPLGWCALLGNELMLTYLLQARADPELTNKQGLRPIDLANTDRFRALFEDTSDQVTFTRTLTGEP